MGPGNSHAKTQRKGVHLRLGRDPLVDFESGKRGVRLVALFNMVDLQKDYPGYSMVYDGRRIRKLVQGKDMSDYITRDELQRFVVDIINAAKEDKRILGYMKENPFPFRAK